MLDSARHPAPLCASISVHRVAVVPGPEVDPRRRRSARARPTAPHGWRRARAHRSGPARRPLRRQLARALRGARARAGWACRSRWHRAPRCPSRRARSPRRSPPSATRARSTCPRRALRFDRRARALLAAREEHGQLPRADPERPQVLLRSCTMPRSAYRTSPDGPVSSAFQPPLATTRRLPRRATRGTRAPCPPSRRGRPARHGRHRRSASSRAACSIASAARRCCDSRPLWA